MRDKEREYAARRRRLRACAAGEGLFGILLNKLEDVRYLCGFSGSNGMILLLPRSGYFLTDFRYREQSREEVVGLRVVIHEGDPGKGLRDILQRRVSRVPVGRGGGAGREGARGTGGVRDTVGGRSSLPRIGYDPHALTCAELYLLRRRLRGLASLVSLKSDVQYLRARKSPAELEVTRRGIGIAEAAFREALRGLKRGSTERDLAVELDCAARRRGAEDTAFETIVAGGVRGALVHARPSDSRLTGAVVVDWGVVFEGYCTDCTRTVTLGRVPAEIRKVHRLVLEAQERALERIGPGVRAREVDLLAREVLEKAGYGKAFGHGLGHGVGLEVHEMPHLSPRSRDVLEEGMVLTVEPGVYLPGVGGVRVEDMVLVTSSGAEVLTSLPRSMDPSDY